MLRAGASRAEGPQEEADMAKAEVPKEAIQAVGVGPEQQRKQSRQAGTCM